MCRKSPPIPVLSGLVVCLVFALSAPTATLADETRLTQDAINHFYPQWSPDGGSLVYFRGGNNRDNPFEIYRISSAGGTETAITSNGGQNMHPQWSPDGSKVVYQSLDAAGYFQIRTAPASGGSEAILTSAPFDHLYPQWSRDGTLIVYQRSDAAGRFQIAFVPATGGSETVLTSDAFDHYSPQFSPDGTQIVYEKMDATGYRQIYRVSSSGGSEIALTSEPVYHGGPQWSPDGTTIAYAKGDLHTGIAQICTIPAAGGTQTVLTSDAYFHSIPRWSPDGAYIMYSKGDYTGYLQIYKVPAGGGEEIAVTSILTNHIAPQWSPDGTKAAYFRYDYPPTGLPDTKYLRLYVATTSGLDTAALPATLLAGTSHTGGTGTTPPAPPAKDTRSPGLPLAYIFFPACALCCAGLLIARPAASRILPTLAAKGSRIPARTSTILLIAAALAGTSAPDAFAQTPLPRFGALSTGFGYNFNLLRKTGMKDLLVFTAQWSYLMPDGVNFDPDALADLDATIRKLSANNIIPLVRVTTGGSTLHPFRGIPDPADWPVDVSNYSVFGPTRGIKYGEFLGDQLAELQGASFPPKVLTRDEPGDTSPWYDYVYALAQRYDGTTPDPLNPGAYLPKVTYWEAVEEQDSKGYWYGTSVEYYGGIGGDPEVGVLPSMIRAVKRAIPDALVIAPGQIVFSSFGLHLVEEAGGVDAALQSKLMEFAYVYGTNYNVQRALKPDDILALYNTLESRRPIAFFDRSIENADQYDIYSYHAYTASHQFHRFFLDFLRDRLDQSKPGMLIWDTEMGFFVVPDNSYSRTLQAYDMIKMIGSVFSHSGVHVTYAPLSDFPYAYGLFNGSWVPYDAQKSFALIARKLDEVRGLDFDSTVTVGKTLLHTFKTADGAGHLAVAWYDRCFEVDGTYIPYHCTDPETEVHDVGSALGLPSQFALYDYLGNLSCAHSTTLTFSEAPALIAWGTDTDADCVPDAVDNCPAAANATQSDKDDDAVGDACDPCPNNFDPDQIDADGDHYTTGCDCNDSDPTVHPKAPETPGDGVDSNCNGQDDCFIATAAFGSAADTKIDILRSFRDRHLMRSVAGEQFVEAYYLHSPPVADYLRAHPWLRTLTRVLLHPVVGLVSLLM